ncbi:hypothetical protein IQ06DRAFT_313376 [Phaeosphaeriaceae sp. SRC1lsM3a]|nr:hypothetical protein IQ06DRAFT_313376 [Stagonospora sp. SRC1lsM3a]
MWHAMCNLAIVIIAICHVCCALEVSILADTNRDGRVDVSGGTDAQDKAFWTENRGALFLPNIGDSGKRCSNQIQDSMPDNELDKCHDASDNVLRNPQYLAPLRVVCTGLSALAQGSIKITNTTAAEKVRIFHNQDNDWHFVSKDYTFSAQQLQSGLQLGIDGRDVRRPGGWDGRVQLQFTVSDNGTSSSDSVALRVAPILTHHHGQSVQRVISSAGRAGTPQSEFVSALKQKVADAGITEPLLLLDEGDIWAQDFFEPAYASIPGTAGSITLQVMLRSSQPFRKAGRQVFSHLRSESTGAVQHPGTGGSTDSTGNLETIPPYTFAGLSYPAGRIIMGSQNGVRPIIFPFLEAQEIQKPIELDTSWLEVGHVDEFLQFLPSNNKRGWVVMVDDPLAALGLLRNVSAQGYGSTAAVSRLKLASDPSYGCLPRQNIDQLLQATDFVKLNEESAKNIEANINILKRETGITNEEILRIPSLYYSPMKDPWTCTSRNRMRKRQSLEEIAKPLNIIEAAQPPNLEKRQSSQDRVAALYPGTVNGLVLSRNVIAPNPWGPIINGQDILARAVSDIYIKSGHNITFMDDWFSHHTLLGEVHCGSNVWRSADTAWW